MSVRSRVLYSRRASDKRGLVAALSLLTKNMVLCVWQGYGGGGSDDNIQTAWTTHTRRVDRIRALSRCVVTTKNRDDNVHAGVCVSVNPVHTHTHTHTSDWYGAGGGARTCMIGSGSVWRNQLRP